MTQTTSQTSSAIRVSKPSTGANLNIEPVPGGSIAFDFDPSTATVARSGNDLAFTLDDGGTITLSDFFVVGDQALPSLVLPDGTTVASADFLAAFDIDLETAAGSGAGAGAAGSGAGEYTDDAGALIDGIDRLGSLGTDQWGYESEVPEEFTGLLADAGLDGGIELPGGPGPEQPEEPEQPEVRTPELHAHDNVGFIIVDQDEGGTTYTPSGLAEKGFDAEDGWRRTGQEGPDKATGSEIKIFSASGDIGDDFKDLCPNLDATINSLLRAGTTFSGENSYSGAVACPFTVGAGETGMISFTWSFDQRNSGQYDEQDAAYVIIVDDKGTVVWACPICQFQENEMGAFESGSFTAPPEGEAALEPGNYHVIFGVAEVGNNAGQNPILTVSDIEQIHIVTEPPGWTMDFKGNVLEEALHVTSGGDLHDKGIDHIVDENGDIQELSEAAFVSEWTFTDPATGEEHTVTFDARGQEKSFGPFGYGEDGAEYTITFRSDGSYEFTMSGEGIAPSVDDFNVGYTVKDGELTSDPADLYIRTPDHIGAATDGNDVIFATDEGGVIFGGAGSDVIYGGAGEDIFSWGANDFDGSTDKIMDFSFADGDKLSFEGLVDLGAVDVKVEGDVVTLTVPGGGGNVTVEVNFQGNELQDFVAAHADSSAEAMNAALIQAMIQNATGT